MSYYTVVSDVGRSLVQLLREHMSPEPVAHPEMIGLSTPWDNGNFAVTLFLYRVDEHQEGRRTTMINRGAESQQYPPMVLNLHYLLTIQSKSDPVARAIDEHRMFGRAMQVFNDHSIVEPSLLQGSLADTDAVIRITLEDLPLERLQAFFSNGSYKLSLSYVVGPIYVGSTRTKTVKRVTERTFVSEHK
jgi:hypothetical protein